MSNLGYRYYAHRLHRFYNCDWVISAGRDRRQPPVPPAVEAAPVQMTVYGNVPLSNPVR
jgi:hypothetical protein